jgi:hypothetical protein
LARASSGSAATSFEPAAAWRLEQGGAQFGDLDLAGKETLRRRGVDEAEEFNVLTGGLQLQRHLKHDEPAEAEFVAHDSRLRFGSLNHAPGDTINLERPIAADDNTLPRSAKTWRRFS